ncbi:MAG: hypothetical protein NTV48_03145, partial [Candidatus Vogelbacteria bacterium]|nr:hypothetical protein [Candidatus Vogelbacteria bacterium]
NIRFGSVSEVCNKARKGMLTMDDMLSKVQESARRMNVFLGPLISYVIDAEVGGVFHSFFEKLTGNKAMAWWEEFKKFCRGETCWATRNPYLRKIADGKLAATTGKQVLAMMVKLFRGFLDPNFTNWGTNVPGKATAEALFEVWEMFKENGTLAQIFGGFGIDLDKLCWSQDQIITFVETHADLLHPEGWATFFLFRVGDEFFVAYVLRYGDGRLRANVDPLSNGYVWDAEHRFRFVVPQLDALKP